VGVPDEKLKPYRAKRDFVATPEPAGDRASPGIKGQPRFVVQEHHATRLHWDLRLEHAGALASWAIPNGIPATPQDNRLAVHTEDHPLEYLDFHGEIPKGQYGAGTMTIWDQGTYELHKWEERKVEVTFHGERLHGRYGLFPIGRGAGGDRAGGDRAGGDRAGGDRAGGDPNKDWMIHRMDPPEDPDRRPIPERIVPMMARLGTLPSDPDRWSFEVKWDGVRAIAYAQPGRLRLESRNLNDVTDAYPEVRGLVENLGMREAVLDGEIVTFNYSDPAHPRPSFERLQRRMHVTSPAAVRRLMTSHPVVYAIFDLLFLDGHSLMDLPYRERRERLEALELGGRAWRVPAAQPGAGAALLEATREQGLEGIVAKRLDCTYEPGRRSGAWLKIKHTLRQELVIGGWIPGEGRRSKRIGALLMGYYRDGDFLYAGRVGTGFTERSLAELQGRLESYRRSTSPFAGRVGGNPIPRDAVFVEPCLVAEIEFREWTGERVMRAPSFKGLRDDKAPREVVLESAAPKAQAPAQATQSRADPPSASAAAPPSVSAVTTPSASAVTTPSVSAAAPPSSPEALFDEVERLPDGALAVLVEGRRLRISNWDKVLYPVEGFTKGDLVAYYARIAPAVLPHLHDRPLTLKRYPEGVEAQHFYEKQAPSHRPEWVQTERVGNINYVLAQDRPTLVWLANLADIELHSSLSLARAPEEPTMLVFDLDPGPPAGMLECCEVGEVLHGLFGQLGLESYAKTSGSKGLQVYVPLNTGAAYEDTKPMARRIAELLEQRMPGLVVSRMTKRLRPGKVLVDWSQNDAHKTTVTVYSVRARERPTVSTPVSWDEVAQAREAGAAELLSFDTEQVLARVAEQGDLFADVVGLTQRLPGLR
jgi:bifunctional non-homologous end joining protein LigD